MQYALWWILPPQKQNIFIYVWVKWEFLRCRHPQLLSAQSIALARVLSELTPPEIWYKTAHRQALRELRVRIMALVQSSREQRSSMQRLSDLQNSPCPTLKRKQVQCRRCRKPTNRPATLTEDVLLLERWKYTALNWRMRYVLINCHHKT